MIRVIIVEDEPFTANALAILIKKSGEPFDVIHIAENGREALPYLKSGRADVVFTDIRMPIMDGMTLLKNMQEEHIEVPTVIISGYSEFDYARQALKYQVVDYLLKPLSPQGLAPVLERLKSVYEKRSRDKFMNLLSANISEEKPLQPGKCHMAVIALGILPSSPDDILLPGNRYEYQVILQDELKKINQEDVSSWLIHGSSSVEWILIIECFKDEFDGNLFLQNYFDNVRKHMDIPVTFASCKSGININSIGTARKKLKSFLYKRTVFSKSKFFIVGNESETTSTDYKVNKWIEVLYSSIRKNEQNVFDMTLKNYLEFCEKSEITQARLFRQIQRITEYYRESFSILQDESNIYFEPSCCTYGELYHELLDIYSVITKQNSEVGILNSNPLAYEIKQYLDQHFAENLTNEHLSKKFGFVPSYLGRIFKKEYGRTIGNYILSRRIDESKKLLAKEGAMVKDVALRVGYSDPYYFSKVFKKNVGCWPSDYH